MAEIPIQPKKGGSMLPWILGALAILLLLWFLMGRGDDDDAAPAGTDTTKTTSITSVRQHALAHIASTPGWRV